MVNPTLERVTLTLCSLCLDGEGGECHVPGCALWLSAAPDVSLRDKIIEPVPVWPAGELPLTAEMFRDRADRGEPDESF